MLFCHAFTIVDFPSKTFNWVLNLPDAAWVVLTMGSSHTRPGSKMTAIGSKVLLLVLYYEVKSSYTSQENQVSFDL